MRIDDIARIEAIGFEKIGHWSIAEGGIACTLLKYGEKSKILYSFISEGEVKYIGKTAKALRVRLNGYIRPGATQTTNIKVKGKIIENLNTNNPVEIFVFIGNELLHYGEFSLSLAAGLEDDMIHRLSPAWNQTGNKNVNRVINVGSPVRQLAEPQHSVGITMADAIRNYVYKNYIKPARTEARKTITIRAGDIHKALGLKNSYPNVCEAIRSKKFLDKYGVTIDKWDGPERGANVFVTYGL